MSTIFSLIASLALHVKALDNAPVNPLLNDGDIAIIQQRANKALAQIVEAVEDDPFLSERSADVFQLVKTTLEVIGNGYYASCFKFLGESDHWEVKPRG